MEITVKPFYKAIAKLSKGKTTRYFGTYEEAEAWLTEAISRDFAYEGYIEKHYRQVFNVAQVDMEYVSILAQEIN